MHREIDVSRERLFAIGSLDVEDTEIRINRSGGTNDVGVQLARIPADGSVAHEITAIEAEVIDAAPACEGAGVSEVLLGEPHTFGDELWQFGCVTRRDVFLAALRSVARGAAAQDRSGVG